MLRKLILTAMALSICTVTFCTKPASNDKKMVRVGNRVLMQSDLNDFSEMMRKYPYELPRSFPGERSQITSMLETEALYHSLPMGFDKKSIKNSQDWKWKSRFFPAQLFTFNILVRNMGFSDTELQTWYNTHKDSNKVTVKIGGDTAAAKDTLSTDTALARTAKAKFAASQRDSVYFRPFAEVREQIAETMFGAKYPPDSAFIASTFGENKPDPATIKKEWFFHVKRKDLDFFLRKMYKELYGSAIPDSTAEFFGPGKLLTPDDMKTILNWLPENRRSLYNNPNGERELAMWLLRWKVYSSMAEKMGFMKDKEVKGLMEWAWKVQVVQEFVTKDLVAKAKKHTKIDSTMCRWSYWDASSSVIDPPDSAGLKAEMQRQFDRESTVMLDSLIWSIRKQKGVVFLQTEQKDEKDQNPAQLLLKGDSLRDTGNIDGAEGYYQKLVNGFPFVSEGRKAMVEIAKIQTDRQLFREAIDNYRRYLITGRDPSRMCNNFFMIGFIYDEHMNQPALAQINYKWILKNEPGCELADDAEFMCLHLDEPLTRIEELRAEALRQGRIVEPDDTTAVESTADNAQ